MVVHDYDVADNKWAESAAGFNIKLNALWYRLVLEMLPFNWKLKPFSIGVQNLWKVHTEVKTAILARTLKVETQLSNSVET
jgi:hypothetical protein